MRVIVEHYDPQWQVRFQIIKARLEKALKSAEHVSIQHVGSTSVPGLAAKPTIDVDVVVQEQQLASAIQALKLAGYQYQGERGIPDRHAFIAPDTDVSQNIYVCIEGCQALRNHLLIRDLCRHNEELRALYSQKKLELSQQEWANVDEYCVAKNDVLAYILSQGMTAEETDQIKTLNVLAGN